MISHAHRSGHRDHGNIHKIFFPIDQSVAPTFLACQQLQADILESAHGSNMMDVPCLKPWSARYDFLGGIRLSGVTKTKVEWKPEMDDGGGDEVVLC